MSSCLLISTGLNASEYLQIAVRAQHVKRWAIARAVNIQQVKQVILKWRKGFRRNYMQQTASERSCLTAGYSTSKKQSMTAAIIRKEKLKI